jgi:hypothetical protein
MEHTERPTVTIKLKPYLQEYLRSELNNTLIASRRNLIGRLVKPFLMIRPVDVKPEFPTGPDYITFELPNYEDFNVRSNIYITPESQRIIEDFLEIHFKDLFYNYMKDKVRFYRSFKKCILQFCFDYNFTFDYINYEMLKKYFYRRREEEKSGENSNPPTKKMLSGFVPGMSPDCPQDVPGMSLECPQDFPESSREFSRGVPDMSLNPTCVFLV